jgi:glycosyltransferase involved in cell wall biosynthesis
MLEPLYNVECILKAFRLIQNRFHESSLTILGEGSQKQYLMDATARLALKNVHFAGRVERNTIESYYENHDILLNSSNIDNLPLSILEAFASGLPVVSTEAGGIPSMITNQKTGLLVKLDDYESLAAKAIELIENPHLSQTIAKQAYNEVKREYSWQVIRSKWLKVYGME